MRKIFPLLFLLFTIFTGLVQAQVPGLDPAKAVTQYNLDIWTTEKGLPANGIRAIHQTKDSYLWIATEGGLARFDGVQFRVFDKSNTDAILNNDFSCFAESATGELWIGSLGGGLLKLDKGIFNGFGVAQGLPSEVVQALAFDAAGTLWVGTSKGLCKLAGNALTQAGIPDAATKYDVTALIAGENGSLLIGTKKNGLVQLAKNRLSVIQGQNLNNPADEYIRTLCLDSKGSLWVGTNGAGLKQVINNSVVKTYATKEDGLSSPYINYVLEDARGNLWIATANNTCRLQNGTFQEFTTKDGLSYNSCISLGIDREGTLWIGTSRGGVNRLRDGRFTTYTKSNGLADNIVHAVLPATDGGYWIATDGGLNKLENGKLTSPITQLTGKRNRGVFIDKDGDLWVATYGALYKYAKKKLTSYGTSDGLSSDLVRLIAQDHDGTLWIGTRTGLSKYENGKFSNYKDSGVVALASEVIQHVFVDSKNNIWVGTEGAGLVKITKGAKPVVYTTADGLGSDVVYKTTEDADGSLWIGTNGGINHLVNGKFSTINKAQGIISNTIFQLLDDGKGNFWVTTDIGIFSVPKTQLAELEAGKRKLLATTVYTRGEGLKSNECTANGWAVRDANDQLWFPTVGGVALINPGAPSPHLPQPPVAIEQLVVDNQDINILKNPDAVIKMDGSSRKLEIHFTALSFLASDKMEFRFKLEGFDDDWVQAVNNRVAYYTNLPAKTYTFRVEARRPGGEWIQARNTLKLERQPRFLETIWFYVLLALVLGAVGYLIYRVRIRSYKLREEQLSSLVAERTESLEQSNKDLSKSLNDLHQAQDQLIASEKMAALGQLIAGVAHEINTPIGAINAAANNINKSLPNALQQLPEMMAELSAENKALFYQMLDSSLDFKGSLTSREERQHRKEITKFLEENQVENVDELSSDLVKVGILNNIGTFLPLLRLPQSVQLIELAGSVGKLRLNLSNISLAASKTEKIVYALKSYAYKQADDVMVPVDVRQNVDTVLTLYQNKFKHGVELTKLYADNLPETMGFPDELNQVWTNIIHNALQAMNDSGKLSVQIFAQMGQMMVKITDNGPGIPADVLPRIFQPFFTTKGQGEGSGLGLDICRKIIEEKHHGSITVQSVPGDTTFTVAIPIIEPTSDMRGVLLPSAVQSKA